MATLIHSLCRPSIGLRSVHQRVICTRKLSTLPGNPHIYSFDFPQNPSEKLLTLLPTDPPNASLAIGSTRSIPPEARPQSFTSNPRFLSLLQEILKTHAVKDPVVQSSAAAYASQAGSTLSGGVLLPANHPARQHQRNRRGADRVPGTGGAGPSGSQGGSGGGGQHGWVHVYDLRHPPDFGRIPDPEDIFGSVEVDGTGLFVGEDGNYQQSGTYRIVTRDGVLGLSDYLREKLVERLRELEALDKSETN